MTCGAISFSLTDFDRSVYHVYDAGRRAEPWECSINWEALGHNNLSPKLQDLAWAMASSSAYVEQVGMLTAARLMQDCDDYILRLNLARAVADEARHSEAFGKYALITKGNLAPKGNNAIKFENELIVDYSIDEFAYKFFIHSLLEAVAVEMFSIFEHIFDGSELARIYHFAKIDEARHVALGLSHLSQLVLRKKTSINALTDYLNNHYDVVFPSNQSCEFLAKYAELDSEVIRKRFSNRIDNFMKSII